MVEYIEKKKVINVLTAAGVADSDKRRRTWARAICKVDGISASDVAPVVHGEWVEEKYQTISVSKGRTINNTKNCCSVCGNSNGRVKTSYCPHCGAKMDGGEKDAEVQA